jgi:DNA-binding transcriptional ArsR family regulator
MATADQLTLVFAALADPTRRAVLGRLKRGEATVGELAQDFDMSAPSFSRHVKVLERAGLIAREPDAQWRRCRLQEPALRAAVEWLKTYERLWDDQLDKLAQYVGALNERKPRKVRRARRG